jgi:hypothetical protein
MLSPSLAVFKRLHRDSIDMYCLCSSSTVPFSCKLGGTLEKTLHQESQACLDVRVLAAHTLAAQTDCTCPNAS